MGFLSISCQAFKCTNAEPDIIFSVLQFYRYYLVFVSLLWNGIEGFNMYLMLVRVFNARISHFKVKAAAVAWGKIFKKVYRLNLTFTFTTIIRITLIHLLDSWM